MLWSSFGDEGYAMGIALSESGSIAGPWRQHDQPLWARNGGHGMVLIRSDGTSLLVFHWPDETPHERVKIARCRSSLTTSGSWKADTDLRFRT
jgi:hypothetical protein